MFLPLFAPGSGDGNLKMLASDTGQRIMGSEDEMTLPGHLVRHAFMESIIRTRRGHRMTPVPRPFHGGSTHDPIHT